LLVSAEVAKALKKNSAKKHLLDTHSETNELLWLLPEDLALAEGLLIGDVAGAACRLALRTRPTSTALPHLAAYADLAIRSILRLKQFNPDEARIAISKSSIDVLRNRLTRLYDRIGENSAGRRESLFRLLKCLAAPTTAACRRATRSAVAESASPLRRQIATFADTGPPGALRRPQTALLSRR
jgi:hypothetical protein